MTTPLRDILDRIGWTVPYLAARLGCSYGLVRQWETGRNTRGNPCSPPPEVQEWLNSLARYHDEHPPPTSTSRTRRV